ncbi:MAG TPA: hypothetical protein GXX31_06210 [Methanothermobacter sp.]|jgi:uncharacterized UPF0146 family protein|uniref:UPF0146 protein MTTB_04240 n=1 Tax=Methanothermobacter tenebrarum TaxID=680118 RepID=A0ABM7YCV9_9EURY|nr:UPF0146 family protein [Methanothermobacter tenebrarum]MDD3454206.1 UPF0146 family protein [Methanobacteriales archaeon]MDI6881953.1 UPF0146 family protein [Methanothermobacter sp.]MDX9693390.1 UPF0146 family protein [Methanothermobacter sp.]BDH79045.1 hypothetical protein MTTB_04240 [Methanothermobacter tenebrarum]HHW16942.1 hypothetical protein [Methanothermobacter sp.]
MWEDLASYIIQECNPNDKVVEVGVGRFFKVAEYLQEYSMIDLILTDIKPSHPYIIEDDITNPRWEIYKGARLIYSIRPPMELHKPLIKVADKVKAKLLIRPLVTEPPIMDMNLINYKRSFFYEYQPSRRRYLG